MIWVFFVNFHASFTKIRRNSIELLFRHLNNQSQIPKGAVFQIKSYIATEHELFQQKGKKEDQRRQKKVSSMSTYKTSPPPSPQISSLQIVHLKGLTKPVLNSTVCFDNNKQLLSYRMHFFVLTSFCSLFLLNPLHLVFSKIVPLGICY